MPTTPRVSTLSIALPGSIIGNAKSHDQKTYLAGTIARSLAVFNVDEVVIFDDGTSSSSHSSHTATTSTRQRSNVEDDESYTALADPSHFLAHVLSYLETPPHLRRTLFPMHPNLRTAGTLPSLDMPHHLRSHEVCPYREGVTTKASKAGTDVDLGLPSPAFVKGVQIPPNTRVTLRLDDDSTPNDAEAVAPTAPRTEGGYYWGYTVRRAASLSAVFTECPFDGGYDVSFGTSERGQPLSDLTSSLPLQTSPSTSISPPTSIPRYNHLLITFGGVAGLECAAKNDPNLSERGITGTRTGELFDYWVNLVPGQGSRTIRTEEAVWCGLMGLRGVVEGRRGGGSGDEEFK